MGVLKATTRWWSNRPSAAGEAGGAGVARNVVIKSADPEVVYVPQYPPEMLYEENYVMPPQPIYYPEPYPSYWYPSRPTGPV